MVSEIITVYGKTDNSSTEGDFTLYSPAFTNTPTYLKFDKGLKIKIWAKRISGAACKVKIMYTSDVTASSPDWKEVGTEELTSAGEILLEKRHPTIIYCNTGKEAIKFSWEQSTAGLTYIEVDLEIEDISAR